MVAILVLERLVYSKVVVLKFHIIIVSKFILLVFKMG